MNVETIKSNSVFCGYRGSDDSLIIRGAVPVRGAARSDLIEAAVDAFRIELEAAYDSRDRVKKS